MRPVLEKKKRGKPGERILPRRGLYNFLKGLSLIATKVVFAYKVDRNPEVSKLSGPMIIVANHQSYSDPAFAVAAFPERSISFVTGAYLFDKPVFGKILSELGAIPKRQFYSDPSSVRQMLRVLKAGGTVLVYPEGQRSFDGSPCPVLDGVSRLAVHSGAAVVAYRQYGGSLAWPRWSPKLFRPGPVKGEKVILRAPDDAQVDVADLSKRIEESLRVNDVIWQEKQRKPKRYLCLEPSLGLERICYDCQECGAKLSMRASKQCLYCLHCGLELKLKADGFLYRGNQKYETSPSPWHWREAQIEALMDEIRKGGTEPVIEFNCKARKLTQEDDEAVEGKFAIGAFGMRFTPLREGDLSFAAPLKSDLGSFTELGEYFQLHPNQDAIRFLISDSHHTGIVIDYLEAARRLNEESEGEERQFSAEESEQAVTADATEIDNKA